jgi:hypothetical protein
MKNIHNSSQKKQIYFNIEIFKAFDTNRASEIYSFCTIIALTKDKVGVLTSEAINLSHNDRSKIKSCIIKVYGDVSIVKIKSKKPKGKKKLKIKETVEKKEFFEPLNSSKKIPSLDNLPLWQSVRSKIIRYYDEDRIRAWFESEHIEITEKANQLVLSPMNSDFCLQYIYENYSHCLERIAKEEHITIRLVFHQGAVELPFKTIAKDKIEALINQSESAGK